MASAVIASSGAGSNQPSNVTQEFATMIVNGFSLVAALAWTDAIKTVLQRQNLFDAHPLAGPVVFAIVVTILAFIMSKVLIKVIKPTCMTLCAPQVTPTTRPRDS